MQSAPTPPADAPADAPADIPVDETRHRTIGTGHRLGAQRVPTTAEVIHRTDATVARPIYAGIGVALHHFTEPLLDEVDLVPLHRATAVLTKQVCELVEADDVLESIERLVTDPDRIALPDGTTAEQFCGPSWARVLAAAADRAAASLLGGEEFGPTAILNLAVVRGVGAEQPWWGTPMWRQRVELLPDGSASQDERRALLDEPEVVDEHLLALALELGDTTTIRSTEAVTPEPRPVVSPVGAEPTESTAGHSLHVSLC